MSNKRTIGIVGVGPRGLFALERLILTLQQKNKLKKIHFLLFEETGNYGNGQVYDIHQVKTNWINISERILLLDERAQVSLGGLKIPTFPSYHTWINKDFLNIPVNQKDNYPGRAKIGQYLQARCQSLIEPMVQAEIVTRIAERVEHIKMMNNLQIEIKTNGNNFKEIDEILLTIGHQPTDLSTQLMKWKKYFKGNTSISLFDSPYPVKNVLNCENLTARSRVGIRGFGLSMIDVVRGIAEKYGKFEVVNESTQHIKYHKDSDLVNLFAPFSLDGLPVAPKPLNAEIDALFEPNEEQIAAFEKQIGDASAQRSASGNQFLINAITPIISLVYKKLPKTLLSEKLTNQIIEQVTENWLTDDDYEHHTIVPKSQDVEKTMKNYVEMAVGKSAISLDYCAGQVWRHCQPSIYRQLSFNACNNEVFAEIISLDERMKRYAYGPPVESIQQMLALVEAGVMTLEYVNDPEIMLTQHGWKLRKGEQQMILDIMVNSVLDSPQIKAVNSPIVKHLLADDLIKIVHDEYGIETDEHGYLSAKETNKSVPIALLGRLAKGTVIGVDAILECFGDRPDQWAQQAAHRHATWLNRNTK